MVVFINPHAGAGKAMRRWTRVEPGFRVLVGNYRVVVLDEGTHIAKVVEHEAERGETDFVAAGGDGTVNAVGSALLASGRPNLRLGAIALGSSNDFHKPARRAVAGVPIRIDFENATPRDALLIVARTLNAENVDWETMPRFAFITAAVGVTAKANHLFNHPTPVLDRLKGWSSGCAVLWAAVSTIVRHRPDLLAIDATEPSPVANLAVLLSNHCAGLLRYDECLAPSPGRATVAACLDMSRTQLLRVVASLCRGRFKGLPRTRTWDATRIVVSAARPIAVEADGEVFSANEVRFSVLPGALALCP